VARRRTEPPPLIEAGADVRCRSLRFATAPRAEVRWIGETESAGERENLPRPVEPGATYRNVRMRRWVGAR